MKIKFIFFSVGICFTINSLAQIVEDIKIGKQVWKADYLSVSTFKNGDSIPFAASEQDWRIAGEEQKPCYTLLKDSVGSVVIPKTYIYNWYAINDSRGVSIDGYRIPTNSDILELINFCGGICETSKKIKSTSGWDKNDLVDADKKTENGSDEFGLGISPIPMILPTGQQNNCYLSSGFWTVNEAPNGAELRDFFSDEINNHYFGHMAFCLNVSFVDCMNYLNLFFKEGGLPILLIKDNPERNSSNYPIKLFSNTIENLNLEKTKHVEAFCSNCRLLSSDSLLINSQSIFKDTYESEENNQKFVFYFEATNYFTKSENAGIGAQLSNKDGEIIITKIVKGGACDLSKAIFENDVLVGIYENGNLFEFKNLEVSEVIKKIKGIENTPIKLSVKSSETNKKIDIKLVRKKLPNWDLETMIDRSNYQSVFPNIIDNYYFYYKYKVIPENYKYSDKSRFAYIASKASRLYYAGPENYSLDDHFNYPKPEWDKDEIISGAFQLATLFKGGAELNPIILNSIDDAKNLLMTFHFRMINTEILQSENPIFEIRFEHIIDKSQIIIYFEFQTAPTKEELEKTVNKKADLINDGLSIKTAIKVNSVDEEYSLLSTLCDDCKLKSQGLASQGKRHYDIMRMLTPNNEEVVYYFDITSFYGKF